ncbi:RNA polymerase sigma factor [Dyadobacter sp. CY261]|uniref:RNA polymerase sigma factor n=1 Tax=Dyadobacter sp. CY261 TaxID=2907203 RepID=UPI001F3C7111|nr:sigma-70 family RNA polymerase sigma factor [Dyadobacter sp. CY261]
MENLSDTELLVLIQGNSQKAFAAVVHRHRRQLYSQIYRKTGCEETAKDILQEIYISLWKNRSTIQIDNSFLPYLSKAAHYRVVDEYLAREKKKAAHASILAVGGEQQWSAEEDILAADLESRFADRLRKLSPVVQQVFALSRQEGLSVREIAAQLSLSEQTVKNYISLALRALQETLRKEQALFYIGVGILLS